MAHLRPWSGRAYGVPSWAAQEAKFFPHLSPLGRQTKFRFLGVDFYESRMVPPPRETPGLAKRRNIGRAYFPISEEAEAK